MIFNIVTENEIEKALSKIEEECLFIKEKDYFKDKKQVDVFGEKAIFENIFILEFIKIYLENFSKSANVDIFKFLGQEKEDFLKKLEELIANCAVSGPRVDIYSIGLSEPFISFLISGENILDIYNNKAFLKSSSYLVEHIYKNFIDFFLKKYSKKVNLKEESIKGLLAENLVFEIFRNFEGGNSCLYENVIFKDKNTGKDIAEIDFLFEYSNLLIIGSVKSSDKEKKAFERLYKNQFKQTNLVKSYFLNDNIKSNIEDEGFLINSIEKYNIINLGISFEHLYDTVSLFDRKILNSVNNINKEEGFLVLSFFDLFYIYKTFINNLPLFSDFLWKRSRYYLFFEGLVNENNYLKEKDLGAKENLEHLYLYICSYDFYPHILKKMIAQNKFLDSSQFDYLLDNYFYNEYDKNTPIKRLPIEFYSLLNNCHDFDLGLFLLAPMKGNFKKDLVNNFKKLIKNGPAKNPNVKIVDINKKVLFRVYYGNCGLYI